MPAHTPFSAGQHLFAPAFSLWQLLVRWRCGAVPVTMITRPKGSSPDKVSSFTGEACGAVALTRGTFTGEATFAAVKTDIFTGEGS